MALPLSIYSDPYPFAAHYWQADHAQLLIKLAEQDLMARKYTDCWNKCDEVVTYQVIRREDEIMAYILLAWSVDQLDGVRYLRRKAKTLFDDYYFTQLLENDTAPEVWQWINKAKELLEQIESYENNLNIQHGIQPQKLAGVQEERILNETSQAPSAILSNPEPVGAPSPEPTRAPNPETIQSPAQLPVRAPIEPPVEDSPPAYVEESKQSEITSLPQPTTGQLEPEIVDPEFWKPVEATLHESPRKPVPAPVQVSLAGPVQAPVFEQKPPKHIPIVPINRDDVIQRGNPAQQDNTLQRNGSVQPDNSVKRHNSVQNPNVVQRNHSVQRNMPPSQPAYTPTEAPSFWAPLPKPVPAPFEAPRQAPVISHTISQRKKKEEVSWIHDKPVQRDSLVIDEHHDANKRRVIVVGKPVKSRRTSTAAEVQKEKDLTIWQKTLSAWR